MNNKTDDGERAFPSHGSMGEVVQEGMSLRDYFAAAALQGMCANGFHPDSSIAVDYSLAGYAFKAYAVANAMLAERERRSGGVA